MSVQQLSFFDLTLMLRAKWRFLLKMTAATTSAALVIALFSTPVYRGEVVLVAVSTDLDEGSLSSLGSGLSGLASLAGLGGFQRDGLEQNIATLGSRALAQRFVTENDLIRTLFYKRWDPVEQRWNKGWVQRILDPVSAVLARVTGETRFGGDGAPTPDEIYRAFDEIRSIAVDRTTGIIRLGIEWQDPESAARWANGYVATANNHIRAQEVNEARKRLQFLSEQLQKTTLTEIQNTLYSLVESETKRAMIANVREEFAFKIIDPATVPELRVWPRRTLLVFVGLVGGFILGLAIILLQNYMRTMRHARSG